MSGAATAWGIHGGSPDEPGRAQIDDEQAVLGLDKEQVDLAVAGGPTRTHRREPADVRVGAGTGRQGSVNALADEPFGVAGGVSGWAGHIPPAGRRCPGDSVAPAGKPQLITRPASSPVATVSTQRGRGPRSRAFVLLYATLSMPHLGRPTWSATMLTVPEVARRLGRNPETIRRWIREGKLRAHKVGTQHIVEEEDLRSAAESEETLPLPPQWGRTITGERMPDVVAAVRRSRAGH